MSGFGAGAVRLKQRRAAAEAVADDQDLKNECLRRTVERLGQPLVNTAKAQRNEHVGDLRSVKLELAHIFSCNCQIRCKMTFAQNAGGAEERSAGTGSGFAQCVDGHLAGWVAGT